MECSPRGAKTKKAQPLLAALLLYLLSDDFNLFHHHGGAGLVIPVGGNGGNLVHNPVSYTHLDVYKRQ